MLYDIENEQTSYNNMDGPQNTILIEIKYYRVHVVWFHFQNQAKLIV